VVLRGVPEMAEAIREVIALPVAVFVVVLSST
jgi:hypothetical protein